MKRSDITDKQVLEAALAYRKDTTPNRPFITDRLMQMTGAPAKVAYAAMERAEGRGLIECGVSLRTAWPTPDGMALLHEGTPDCDVCICPDCRSVRGESL